MSSIGALHTSLSKWLTTTPLGQMVKLFILTSLSLAISDWAQHGSIVWSDWQTWVIVPAGPLLSVGYDYFAKAYPVFGAIATAAATSPNVPDAVKTAIVEAQTTPDPLAPKK